MQKRLLCILSNMNAGGAETFLMKIYRKIDREKYQMDFCVTISQKGFYDDEIEGMGGFIYHIHAKTDSLSQFKMDIKELVREKHYDYVLRITANGIGLLDLKIAKKAGAKVCSARSSNSNDEGGIKSRIMHRLGQILFLRYVDKKIAPSDLAARYTFGKRAYNKGEITILHNALDLDQYAYNSNARIRIRRALGIQDDAIVVGHIGRFMEQKNHEKILQVFQSVIRIKENAILLLVGNGELESKIRNRSVELKVNQNVIFAGVRRDIPEVLSAMDVLLMPSLYEGMPNTVIEAQATGLPCVISNTITKEANITGNVDYLPLAESNDKWAYKVLDASKRKRENTKDVFISKGYDIESAAQQFIRTVFDEA